MMYTFFLLQNSPFLIMGNIPGFKNGDLNRVAELQTLCELSWCCSILKRECLPSSCCVKGPKMRNWLYLRNTRLDQYIGKQK